MITLLLAALQAAPAALKAVPKILEALERLGDIQTAHVAQQRKDEKDKAVIDLIRAARERRLRSKRQAGRVQGDSGSAPDGFGEGGGI